MKLRGYIPFLKKKPQVSVLRLAGVIGANARQALNSASLRGQIEMAFTKGGPDAVALVINSPGGSPVQSSLIAAQIVRLSKEHEVPVYAFVEDVAASGGYWLAVAADEIYADPASIIGSIGVISAGFGLHDLLGRYGVERRVYTAGRSKSMLDPFRPENPEDVTRLKGILEQMHQVFIQHVVDRRGTRLAQDDDLFTGEVWLGQNAKRLGLIDGIGHLEQVMTEKFGELPKFRRFGGKRPLLQRLGTHITDDVAGSLDERAAFARFGL